jgi:hypothetical protein
MTKVLLCDSPNGWTPSDRLIDFYKTKGLSVSKNHINKHRHCPILVEAYGVLGSKIDETCTARFYVAEINEEFYCIMTDGLGSIERVVVLSDIQNSLISVNS